MKSHYQPVVPFVTRKVYSDGGTTATVETARMRGVNDDAFSAQVVDFRERHLEEIEEAAARREHELHVQRQEAKFHKERKARHQLQLAAQPTQRCIPLASDGAVAARSTANTGTRSLWEHMAQHSAQDWNDPRYWEPRELDPTAGRFRDRPQAFTFYLNAVGAKRGEDVGASADSSCGEVPPSQVAQAKERLALYAGEGRDISDTHDVPESNERWTGAPVTSLNNRQMQQHFDQSPHEATCEDAIVSLYYSGERAWESPPTLEAPDVAKLLESLQLTQEKRDKLRLVMKQPRRLFACAAASSRVNERFASIECISHQHIAARPFSAAATPRPRQVQFTVRVGKDTASPVSVSLALDQLVDVTIGAAFSKDLVRLLRTSDDAKNGMAFRTDPETREILEKKVLDFVHQAVKSRSVISNGMKINATAAERKLYQAEFEAYCQGLEKEFPLLAGPQVSFERRASLPAFCCFTLWFLSEDGELARSLNFVAEAEEQALWIECLRDILRVNAARIRRSAPPAAARKAAGNSTSSGSTSLLEKFTKAFQRTKSSSQDAARPSYTSLEERRWKCHCLVLNAKAKGQKRGGPLRDPLQQQHLQDFRVTENLLSQRFTGRHVPQRGVEPDVV